jgi:hypothetical protein
MYTLHKSALFMRQWQAYAQNYKDRAGIQIAERFIAAVEGALLFIGWILRIVSSWIHLTLSVNRKKETTHDPQQNHHL